MNAIETTRTLSAAMLGAGLLAGAYVMLTPRAGSQP